MHNLDVETFVKELWWSLEIENARVYFPEAEFGVCESTGGGIGILYANGLASGAIESKHDGQNQNFLICSVDTTGYAAVALVRV